MPYPFSFSSLLLNSLLFVCVWRGPGMLHSGFWMKKAEIMFVYIYVIVTPTT